jgi:hypothetical protein
MSRNGQKRSHNAEMAEAAKGTLGARRRSNSRLAALIEAEKVDELDDRAARAPEPDSAAVVDFKKKLQEQREAADAAARAHAAESNDKAVVDAAARQQHAAGLNKPNFSKWPVASSVVTGSKFSNRRCLSRTSVTSAATCPARTSTRT